MKYRLRLLNGFSVFKNKTYRALKDIGRENESIAHSETAINNVMKSIEELNAKIREQSSQISASSSAIEEMAASIQSILNSIVTMDANINKLVESSTEEKSGSLPPLK